MESNQIRAVMGQYTARLNDRAPYKKDGELYLRRTDTGEEILYLHATCDELRHGLTNYEQLLSEIKSRFNNESARNILIYAIKYEATRKVYHSQRKWTKIYYDSKILDLKQTSHLKAEKSLEDRRKLQEEISSFKHLRALLIAQIKQKDEEIVSLQKQVNEYIKLCRKYENELAAEKARREELGRRNQSLGSYKGHYNREKRNSEQLKQEIQILQAKIVVLEQQIEAR